MNESTTVAVFAGGVPRRGYAKQRSPVAMTGKTIPPRDYFSCRSFRALGKLFGLRETAAR